MASCSDVQTIAARVSNQTERVDHAITGTIDRVDETTERVRDSVRDKVAQATGFVRGMRAVITSLLTTEPDAEATITPGGIVMNRKKTTGVTSEKTPQDLGGSMAYEYDRVEREDGGGSFLMGLLAGTVLGAGLGMLFAPKAGSEVRKQLSEQATRLRSTASDTINQASEKFNQASAQASEKIGQASDKVSQMVDRGRDVVDRGRDAYERAKAPIA